MINLLFNSVVIAVALRDSDTVDILALTNEMETFSLLSHRHCRLFRKLWDLYRDVEVFSSQIFYYYSAHTTLSLSLSLPLSRSSSNGTHRSVSDVPLTQCLDRLPLKE